MPQQSPLNTQTKNIKDAPSYKQRSFVLKFLLTYFSAITLSVITFFILTFLLPVIFFYFMWTDNSISRAVFAISSDYADVTLSILYIIILGLITYFVKKYKNWTKKEYLTLLITSLLTLIVIFGVFQIYEKEFSLLNENKYKIERELTERVATHLYKPSYMEGKFLGFDNQSTQKAYQGTIYLTPGLAGDYSYTINIHGKKFGPKLIYLSKEKEILTFVLPLDNVVNEWIANNMSTTNTKAGFTLSFEASVFLEFKGTDGDFIENIDQIIYQGATNLETNDKLDININYGDIRYSPTK